MSVMMVEEWRAAPTTEGRYEVSSLGRIRNAKSGRLLSLCIVKGYRTYGDQQPSPGRQRFKKVHREVCWAFNGPPPFEGALVRHLDGDALNNLPENLAWGTHSDNKWDAVRHGTAARGEGHGVAKLTTAKVLEIRRLWTEGGSTKVELAEKYGVSDPLIGKVIRREVWAHV